MSDPAASPSTTGQPLGAQAAAAPSGPISSEPVSAAARPPSAGLPGSGLGRNAAETHAYAQDQDRVVQIMRHNPLFASLEPRLLGLIAAQCTPHFIPAGSVLFRQGEAGGYAYVIIEGAVDIFVDIAFGTIHMAQIGSNHIIGEIGAFSDIPRTATVIAHCDCALLRLDKESLAGIISANPSLAFSVIAELGSRLQNMNRPLAYLTHAALALERDEFDPAMLAALTSGANEFGNFARAFQKMAAEINTKQSLRQEMETAARIQRSILPQGKGLKNSGAFDFAAQMYPAKDVGGDFYDYFLLDEHRVAFMIADVSGKGVPASIFMAVSRTIMKSVAQLAASAEECVARANGIITEENHACMFVTLFYGVLDLRNGALDYCNAGHNEPFILRQDGRLEPLDQTGIAVGMMEDVPYGGGQTVLAPGDALFLYTDGVTEAFDPDGVEYGVARLQRVLAARCGTGAEALVDAVVDDVEAFARGADQSDDITCVALVHRA